jgi:hypothetical protein
MLAGGGGADHPAGSVLGLARLIRGISRSVDVEAQEPVVSDVTGDELLIAIRPGILLIRPYLGTRSR